VKNKEYFTEEMLKKLNDKKFMQKFDSYLDNEFKYEEALDVELVTQKNNHDAIFVDFYSKKCSLLFADKNTCSYKKTLGGLIYYLS